MSDPNMGGLVRASRKMMANTSRGRLQAALAERTRWRRKLTIATNKLAENERTLDRLAAEMAGKLFETEYGNENEQQQS